MKVYKFGGASVRNAEGVRNLKDIVSLEQGELVVVVSAMGKTTNALERVVNAMQAGDHALAQREWQEIQQYHRAICDELGIAAPQVLEAELPHGCDLEGSDYDLFYDQVVPNGELISTRIIADYLCAQGIDAHWVDMTQVMVTDAMYREANVYMDATRQRLCDAVRGHRVSVVQGFIGGAPTGYRTTLGREGSDYSAAIVANLLDGESVTIWKDVPGVLNADPRIRPDAVKIDELTYQDAVELAYSGAQVIHPKTLRPLENKSIPLYVKPFGDPTAMGSVIHSEVSRPINVPIYIWRKNQMLITMRAKDLGFLLEESLSDIFATLHNHRLKISLIQASAVTISVSVDHTRYTDAALAELHERYQVSYNDGLSLLTIRGCTPEVLEAELKGREVLVRQNTRRMARILVRE